MDLSKTLLFQGMEEDEIKTLLRCLHGFTRKFKKGEMILAEGSTTEKLGLILSGKGMISYTDIWGNNSILNHLSPGAVFAEVYAAIPGQPMLVSVSAVEDTTVLFLEVEKVLTSCTNACPFHGRLARNLLRICANKSLQLSQRIQHTTPKTIRGRLMSYFSECVKTFGSSTFTIPYNRQQLADYLNVDRSTMCHELSKMQKEGWIEYRKNKFVVKNKE